MLCLLLCSFGVSFALTTLAFLTRFLHYFSETHAIDLRVPHTFLTRRWGIDWALKLDHLRLLALGEKVLGSFPAGGRAIVRVESPECYRPYKFSPFFLLCDFVHDGVMVEDLQLGTLDDLPEGIFCLVVILFMVVFVVGLQQDEGVLLVPFGQLDSASRPIH